MLTPRDETDDRQVTMTGVSVVAVWDSGSETVVTHTQAVHALQHALDTMHVSVFYPSHCDTSSVFVTLLCDLGPRP